MKVKDLIEQLQEVQNKDIQVRIRSRLYIESDEDMLDRKTGVLEVDKMFSILLADIVWQDTEAGAKEDEFELCAMEYNSI